MTQLTITAYGAYEEVGRSAFVLHDDDRKVLLDAGIKIMPKEKNQRSLAPEGLDDICSELTSVIITHAHLDHSGYIPAIYRAGYSGQVHMTKPTKDLCSVLWRDHLRIEGPYHYSVSHLGEAKRKSSVYNYSNSFRVCDGVTARFYDAGHVLGSASILLDWDGRLILYTGDVSNAITPFHDPVTPPDLDDDIDVLIIETTNGKRVTPSRKEINAEFTKAILKTYSTRSKILIPSFALGRSQEMQMFLVKLFDDFLESKLPLWVDGMILTMNEIHNKYLTKEWVSQRVLSWTKEQGLQSPFEHPGINLVNNETTGGENREVFRRNLVKNDKPNIIVTTSGMLEGGPIHTYLRYAGPTKSNLLAIVGYQVEGTIGNKIISGERNITLKTPWNKEYTLDLQLNIQTYDYSGHLSPTAAEEYVMFMSPKNLYLTHGNLSSIAAMKERFSNLGYNADSLKGKDPTFV
ncbi:MAG: MBL fold metallo-hydrolase [Promethearchaeota archaeon]